jgi:hypothetical protein
LHAVFTLHPAHSDPSPPQTPQASLLRGGARKRGRLPPPPPEAEDEEDEEEEETWRCGA